LESIQADPVNNVMRQLVPKHDNCGKETFLEDRGACSDLTEALVVPLDSLSIDKWRIWYNIHKVVHYFEKHVSSGVVAPMLEGIPFEVGNHVGVAACSRVVLFHGSCSATFGHF
jgi:hypothetical protein